MVSMFVACWLNIGSFVLNCAVTYGIGNGVIGEARMKAYGLKTNREVSAAHNTLVTPKGWAFAIWGLIFTGEAAFTVYQAVTRHSPMMHAIFPWWQATCVGQALWSISFARQDMIGSTLLLAGLVCTLFQVYSIVSAGATTLVEQLCITVPFGLHCSWVCCAAIVNANIAVSVHAPNMQLTIATLSLVAAAICTSLLSVFLSSSLPCCVGAWALQAISLEPAEGYKESRCDDKDVKKDIRGVKSTAANIAIGLGGLAMVLFAKNTITVPKFPFQ